MLTAESSETSIPDGYQDKPHAAIDDSLHHPIHAEEEEDSLLNGFMDLVPVNPLLEENLQQGRLRQSWNVGEARVMYIDQDDLPGCGGKTWEAADVMIDYLSYMEKQGRLQHKRILEVGSGTGLVGIAATMLTNPSSNQAVFLTDLGHLVPLMERNAQKNLDPSELARVQFIPYDWFQPPPEALQKYMPLDLILVSDCVYLELLFEPLIQTLISLSKPYSATPSTSIKNASSNAFLKSPPEIWISYKRRRRANRLFWKRFEKFFSLELVTDHPDYDSYSKKKLFLYRAVWKGIEYFAPPSFSHDKES